MQGREEFTNAAVEISHQDVQIVAHRYSLEGLMLKLELQYFGHLV